MLIEITLSKYFTFSARASGRAYSAPLQSALGPTLRVVSSIKIYYYGVAEEDILAGEVVSVAL